jgi:hypothetical protein
MKNFYDWFLDTNRHEDIKEQEKLIDAAKQLKDYFTNGKNKIPKNSIFLYRKLIKNIQEGFRGQIVIKNVIGILDEIIDPNNSSSKLYWCKSVRKQGVEKLQRKYLKEIYKVEILSGKENGVTPSGPNSFRFKLDDYEFVKGAKKIQGKTTKSMDGFINLESGVKGWTFQKVTTDNGGATDSVEAEVYETIKAVKNYFKIKNSSDKFIFILDGPFYQRKQYKSDDTTRFGKLYNFSDDNILIVTSDSLLDELKKRGLKQ